MSAPRLDRPDLIARLDRLERWQRLLRPLAGLAVVVLVAGLAAFAWQAPEVVQTQRLELLNSHGQLQAALTADTGGVILTLLDKRGRPSASLRLNADPRLAVVDGAGREVAGLGAPRAQHLVQ
jgi:hypothetical protein